MIFINKFADYSACAIGKVDIDNRVDELIKAAYPSISSANKSKLKTFFNAIGGIDGYIWKKIQKIAFPFVSSSKDEALYDLKNQAKLYDGNEGVWDFSSGLLSRNAASSATFGTDSQTPLYKLSLMVSIEKISSVASTSYIAKTGGGSLNFSTAGSTRLQFHNSHYGAICNEPNYLVSTLVNTGFSSTEGRMFTDYRTNGVPFQVDTSGWFDGTAIGDIYFGSSTNANFSDNIKFKVLGYAYGLTESEAETMRDAIVALVE